ncbi:MAG: Scr1 family TA system antitoxin-like transcriptional regulator [Stackebrandtia sp.]
MTAVIGEAALQLSMGDEVMELQKQHLLELAKLPHVELLVTPLSSGRHDVHGIEFNILEFDDGSENLIYVHAGYGGRYISPDSRAGRFFAANHGRAEELSIPLEEHLS